MLEPQKRSVSRRAFANSRGPKVSTPGFAESDPVAPRRYLCKGPAATVDVPTARLLCRRKGWYPSPGPGSGI